MLIVPYILGIISIDYLYWFGIWRINSYLHWFKAFNIENLYDKVQLILLLVVHLVGAYSSIQLGS